MNTLNGNMTISDLSKQSGIPTSTIKFYLRKELLPKPIKAGATRAFYSQKYLDRLKLIKKIQKEGKMSLDKIKEITSMIDAEAKREQQNLSAEVPNIKSEIIQAAIKLFREKGYESVTIAELVSSAQIGCSTFYRNFSNKKELFMSCIHEIISSEDDTDDLEETTDDTDIFRFFIDATQTATKTSIVLRSMMDQLRAAAINDPSEFAGKMDEVIQSRLQAYERRIQKGIKKGHIRDLDKKVLAIIIYGIEEAAFEYAQKRNYDESEMDALSEKIADVLLYGIIKK